MSNETTELISTYLKEAGFSEEQAMKADSEILYALVGLQTLDSAISKIGDISNSRAENLSLLKEKLQSNIFSKYSELGVIKEILEKEAEIKSTAEETKEEATNRLKERIQMGTAEQVEKAQQKIENVPVMPPANLPMVEPEEVVHDVKPMVPEVSSKQQEVGMVEEKKKELSKLVVEKSIPKNTHYPSGDPYREPV